MSYQKSAYEGIGGSVSLDPVEGATAPLSSSLRPVTTSSTKVQLKLYVITLITLIFNFTALMAGFYSYDVTIADSAIVQPPWLVNMHSWGSFSPIYWVHCSFDPGANDIASCSTYAEVDAGEAFDAASPFTVAGPGAAFFVIVQILVCFAVIELIHPTLRFTVGRFIHEEGKRLRWAVFLQLMQAILALCALMWFFIAMGARGFNQDTFFSTVILAYPGATRDWMAGGKGNIGTLGPGGVVTLLQILLLPFAWWYLRRRLIV